MTIRGCNIEIHQKICIFIAGHNSADNWKLQSRPIFPNVYGFKGRYNVEDSGKVPGGVF